jgi:folate-binding protein YgfZ
VTSPLLTDLHRRLGAHVVDAGIAHYGDAAAEYRAGLEAALLFDASGRDLLLVTGDDRLSFIQGLCTNDVEALAEGHALEAAFISPKGRLVCDARIVKLDDALLFDLEAGRGAALTDLLSKYRIHEAVEWMAANELLAVLELWGPNAALLLGLGSLASGDGAAVVLEGHAAIAVGTPFGVAVYVPASEVSGFADALGRRVRTEGGRWGGRQAVEAHRVRWGLGRFGIDFDESSNPLEAGLDRMLSYRKGCYVGQEVVAKATYVGQVSRRLVRLSWSGEPVPLSTPLVGPRTPGRLTSVAEVPGEGRTVALGVVRRDAASAGTSLQLGETGRSAAVDGYPFGSKDKPVP